jgi:hypothetical protein
MLLVCLIAPGACVPHSHAGVGVGFYNQDHDLSLFAASSTTAPLPVSPLLFVDVVSASVCQSVPVPSTGFVRRDAESRAPPAA